MQSFLIGLFILTSHVFGIRSSTPADNELVTSGSPLPKDDEDNTTASSTHSWATDEDRTVEAGSTDAHRTTTFAAEEAGERKDSESHQNYTENEKEMSSTESGLKESTKKPLKHRHKQHKGKGKASKSDKPGHHKFKDHRKTSTSTDVYTTHGDTKEESTGSTHLSDTGSSDGPDDATETKSTLTENHEAGNETTDKIRKAVEYNMLKVAGRDSGFYRGAAPVLKASNIDSHGFPKRLPAARPKGYRPPNDDDDDDVDDADEKPKAQFAKKGWMKGTVARPQGQSHYFRQQLKVKSQGFPKRLKKREKNSDELSE